MGGWGAESLRGQTEARGSWGWGSPAAGRCRAAILWPLYAGQRPRTPPRHFKRGRSPHPDPAEPETLPSSLHAHKDSAAFSQLQGSGPSALPSWAAPPHREGNWGRGRLAKGVMTQPQKGVG